MINVTNINPLVTDPLYLLTCMAKISILRKEGIIEKISYERLAYESVDNRRHPSVISQKSAEYETRVNTNGRYIPVKRII